MNRLNFLQVLGGNFTPPPPPPAVLAGKGVGFVGALLVSAVVVALACALTLASCGGSAALEKTDPDGDDAKNSAIDGGGDNKTANATAWVLSDSPFDTEADLVRSNEVKAVAYGAGKFVVGGSNGELAYSEDGKTWTAVSDSGVDGTEISSLTYANGSFFAGSYDRMSKSTDGKTWSKVLMSRNPFGFAAITGLAYIEDKTVINGKEYDFGWFVAVGDKGKIGIQDTGWESVRHTVFTTSNYINGIAYNGNGRLVAVADYGVMGYSTTGRNDSWTKVTTAFDSDHINGIVYGKDKFVAVGAKGKIAYSSDGQAPWYLVDTTVFGDTHNKIYSVTYGGGKYIAVGEQGKIAVSTDATEWKIVGSGVFLENDIFDVAYGNGKFVVVGDSGKIAVSTN